jgi:hypothetical protein
VGGELQQRMHEIAHVPKLQFAIVAPGDQVVLGMSGEGQSTGMLGLKSMLRAHCSWALRMQYASLT